MSGESLEFTHSRFRVWLRPDGIVQIVWGPRVTMGLEDAVAAVDAVAELTGGRRSPLLVDAREPGGPDRPARAEFLRRGEIVSAVALIVVSPLSRIMGNFALNLNKPSAPVRLFDDEASALVWLLEFVA
ncbi:MAG: STAS/SEC14 domain-containing protein [Candidatus Phosphoribacter sp.]